MCGEISASLDFEEIKNFDHMLDLKGVESTTFKAKKLQPNPKNLGATAGATCL